jgi:hypothetical protein
VSLVVREVRMVGDRWLDDWGSIPGKGKIFLFSTVSRPTVGTEGGFPAGRRPGHEADYSPPSSGEVMNGGANLQSPIRLHSIVLN